MIDNFYSVGNKRLLKNHKIAFLCSQKCPASIILKSYDWAIEQREQGNCVISGFHSKIEKDVFHYLLKGDQHIILAEGRGIKQKYNPEITQAINENRLLVISSFDKCLPIMRIFYYLTNHRYLRFFQSIFCLKSG